MLHNIVTIWASKIILQKTVIYMFIKVYQEPDSVCVCVCSTHCDLPYGFIDILGNTVLWVLWEYCIMSNKTYVVLF